ncbi:MAG: hypothetical protein Q7R80_00705 [bacterium]|nr:hypothetical protein [bacterium]
MAPPHAEAMPIPGPQPDDAQLDRPLEHAERMALQLELARRMVNLAELGVPKMDIHDPRVFLRLQTAMAGLSEETREAADARMMAWAEGNMDAFRAIVGAEDDHGAAIRRLIRTAPEAALDRVAELLRRGIH